ncbi:MAG: hypothetical protein Q8N98_04225 [bacterium]|nr:hypothetical protein [bacterium]
MFLRCYISVSYGSTRFYLFLDGRKIGELPLKEEANFNGDVFLGRGPLWNFSGETLSAGRFDVIKIYDYLKAKWN